MANTAAKKITYDNKPVQVESAIRDGSGLVIRDSYLTGFITRFAGNWSGGVHPVNCVTVDYSTCNSENGVFIKFTMACSHGNGQAFRYLEDVVLNVKYTGDVACTLYRYFAETITVTGDYNGMKYGDVFWTIDTTNKIVKFYVLMGQYAYSRMTTYFRLNQSTGGTITQSSGQSTAYEYSTGTKNWASVEDFSTISAKYVKPSTGIPKTDLASAVQTSLGKADTALQTAPVTSVNTETGAVVLDGADIALTGYSKPSTSSSVTATDTVNQAIGKLEKSIELLPTPMQFKGTVGTNGTITSLPTASSSNNGYVYKAISDATSPVTYKTGDTVVSNGSTWIVIPSGDEPSGTVTNVATGVGLTGGPITTTGTIKVKLLSETNATYDSSITDIQGRQYAVVPDKTNGYLSVNVPWTDTHVRQAVADGSDDTNRAVLLSGFSNTETVEYLDSYTVQSKKIYASDVTGTITAPHFHNSTTNSSLDFVVGSTFQLTEVD